MNTKRETMPGNQGSPPPAQDLDDFDAAMAEASGASDSPASAADDDGDDKGQPRTADTAPADEAAASAPPAADPAQGGSSQDNDDIWASAPSELRQRYDETKRDYELRMKSIQGRQSASDRELARLRQELAELKQQGGKQPATGDDTNANEGGNAQDEFKSILEDYPDIAGPLVNRIKALEESLKPLKQGVDSVQQERTNTFLAGQTNILAEAHPDWQQVAGDERFEGWLSEQPRMYREAFERNREAIVDGREAASVVGAFKEAMGIKPATGNKPPATDERRKRQLENGRDFSHGSGPAATEGIPDDFDAAMDAFSHQADRKRAAR